MNFNASSSSLLKLKADAIVLLTGPKLTGNVQELDEANNGVISELTKAGDFKGNKGEALVVHLPAGNIKRLVLVGTGDKTDIQSLGRIAQAGATALLKTPSKKALWLGEGLSGDSSMNASIVARCLLEASYKYSPKKTKAPSLASLTYLVAERKEVSPVSKGLDFGAAVGLGMNKARQLGNLPANICTPSYLASQARALAKGNTAMSVKVLSEADMKKLKMGSLLSVSAGTEEPAKLIVMEYQGGKKTDQPVALVGKAVTFDSGGISLKPGAAMDEMKFDMCGGASVFGVMEALVESELPINVVGVVPAVENMPSGDATKPGDVVTSMSGQTIEVLNTDAEGRLILCDALTYVGRYKPKAVIDIATLTGACVMALGKQASGLLSNSDALADDLLSCGQTSGDRVWRLPLWEEYDQQLKSNFADMANIGGREAGTITAGCFLARFTKDYTWAHLDIAGTAWFSGAKKGSTGRPVPLLMEYLRSL